MGQSRLARFSSELLALKIVVHTLALGIAANCLEQFVIYVVYRVDHLWFEEFELTSQERREVSADSSFMVS